MSGPDLALDPVLPQRDLLLDAEAIAPRLAGLLAAGRELESCELVRATYRVGRSLRVVYRVRAQAGDQLVSGRAFRPGRGARACLRAAGEGPQAGSLRPVASDRKLRAVFWTFPNDRKIRQLRDLASSPGTLSAALGWPIAGLELAGYAPEKVATLRCLGGRGETLAYAKVYAGDDGERLAAIHDALAGEPAEGTPLRVPAALAYLRDDRTLLLEPMDGRPLSRLGGPALGDALARLGAAVAAFHELPSPGLAAFERHSPRRLARAAGTIAAARPDCAGLAVALAETLAARWAEPGEPPVCVHGDVHPKNGIGRDGAVALVDLDDAALGPAAADLGSMLAGLRYLRCVGAVSPAAARELARRFVAGYASVRPLPAPETLRWHTAAAALGERALRAITRVRPDGLATLFAVLLDARCLLESGGSFP